MIELHGLRAALGFLGYLALFTLCGLVTARIWLVPSPAFDLPEVYPRWRQMLGECFAVLAFSGVMLLLVRTGEMNGGTLPAILADVPAVLWHTHFGQVWSLHLAALVLIWRGCAACTPHPPSRGWAACMAAGVLLLAFTYSATSHAGNGGDFTLAELNDWVHVAATAIWGGGIIVSALLLFPLLREQHLVIAHAASRLSTLAAAALPFAVVTGIYNSTLQLRSAGALFDTSYGRILTGKLAIVAAVIVIGGLNRFVIVARIRRQAAAGAPGLEQPLRLLFWMLGVDVALVLLAVVMAAVLVQYEIG